MEERDKRWHQTAAGRRYYECYEQAKRLLAEENKTRAAKGEPPRVIPDNPWVMNKAYFPGMEYPPIPPRYHYPANDFIRAMLEVRKAYWPNRIGPDIGLQKTRSKSKIDFSFNVVHFRAAEDKGETQSIAKSDQDTEMRFRELTSKANGEYRSVTGLEAIESYISAAE